MPKQKRAADKANGTTLGYEAERCKTDHALRDSRGVERNET